MRKQSNPITGVAVWEPLLQPRSMVDLSPGTARAFWQALMDNASALVRDAHVLLDVESFGRARSLTVLAQEELGKALWIYDAFQQAWNDGDESPQAVDSLSKHGRSHTAKYLEAFVFGDELASFWGDYEPLAAARQEGESWADAHLRRRHEAEMAAKEANTLKQRGFYVDRDDVGSIMSPTGIDRGTIADDLQTVAQVIEMLLIKDHSRMKHEASTPYDSTRAQQFRLLPISHPEDWAEASDQFKNGDWPNS